MLTQPDLPCSGSSAAASDTAGAGDAEADGDSEADGEATSVTDLSEQLEASEKLMKELTTSWDDKVKQAAAVKQERAKVRRWYREWSLGY